MKKIQIVTRVLLGLLYFVFGLNGFFMFIPVPPMPDGPMQFMQALMATNILYLAKGIEVVGGALLLWGNYLPFATVLLAPITVNIFMFHFFMTPGEWPMSAVMLVAHLALAWSQKDKLKILFQK